MTDVDGDAKVLNDALEAALRDHWRFHRDRLLALGYAEDAIVEQMWGPRVTGLAQHVAQDWTTR